MSKIIHLYDLVFDEDIVSNEDGYQGSLYKVNVKIGRMVVQYKLYIKPIDNRPLYKNDCFVEEAYCDAENYDKLCRLHDKYYPDIYVDELEDDILRPVIRHCVREMIRHNKTKMDFRK